MSDAFARMGELDRRRVLATVGHLEQAAEPLPPDALPADPAFRAAVEACLDRRGRTLVAVGDPGQPAGWTSGYADDVADRLATAGLGVLPAELRAVLALVLLHTVAAPTARGERPEPWSAGPRVTVDVLQRSRALTDLAIRDGLAALHDLGLVRHGRGRGVNPGPALNRLTPERRARIERELLALAAPDDPVIARLLARQRDTDPTDDRSEP